jgi:L-2,4-diaminobutyrate decarboxylase
MDPALESLLSEIELDTTADAASSFAWMAVEYLADARRGAGRVWTPHGPDALGARFDETLPVEGRPLADVIGRLRRDVLPDANRLAHPRAMGHQVSAPLAVAVWTEVVTAALNQSAAVWEMSPVGTMIETQVVRWMCGLAGYGAGAGGTFTSGGTEATFAGLLAARQAALPDAWRRGAGPNPPVVVCGEHAHYGVARAVGELGLGTERMVIVPSSGFRMDVAALERALDALRVGGQDVMAVVATAGTTPTGSFDDIDAIGQACEARGTWLHVDGAHGASALFSPAHRHRLAGLHRARSIAWDPHKMMLMPLTASVVLVRSEGDLEAAFSQQAPYLFHARDGGRRWDQGLRSFTCSRRVDALKVWVALQRYGASGFGRLYDHLCATTRTLYDLVEARPEFEALHEPESNILCFRWVGDRSLTDEQLDSLNLDLRHRFNLGGEGWITTTVLNGRRVLRVTLMNPRTRETDLARVLNGLGALAAGPAGDTP